MTINPAAFSKINWTNIVALAASLGAVFGFDLSPETQVTIVTAIGAVSQVATIIFRTFFTAKP